MSRESLRKSLIKIFEKNKITVKKEEIDEILDDYFGQNSHQTEEDVPKTCHQIRNFFDECEEIFMNKQSDRGPGNISKFGSKGIVLRLADKQARLEQIVWHEKQQKVSEPIENEYKDIAIYCAIDSCIRKGVWGE